MAEPRIHVPAAALTAVGLAPGLAAIRQEMKLPGPFPAPVTAEAQAGSAAGHPDAASWLAAGGARADHRGLPLVTLDPLGSRDLDQAFAIVAEPGGGHTLHYAIADVAAHVRPGGAIEQESRLRGETIYLPGGRIPLHPPELSEGAASLLPGVDRLAVLWSLSIGPGGQLTATSVERSTVRSTAQLDYAGASAALAAGTADPQLVLLGELGPRLMAAARLREAIELPEPAQELVDDGSGGWTLEWLPRDPVEDWNAQLSLTTGRAAATLMLAARSGLLRTLPPAPPEAEPKLRMAAQALGVDWPVDEAVAARVARLDPSQSKDLALIDAARSLLRGAGYLALAGQEPAPDAAIHAAVGAPYAHVTAPLRRLGDRYATEAALAAAAGVPAPGWVVAALPELPALLSTSGHRSNAASRAVVDLAESTILAPRVGETFDAAVIDREGGTADIRIASPPVQARAAGAHLEPGTQAQVRLISADPATRKVKFAADVT